MIRDRSWQASAVCAQVDPELWFPPQGEARYTARVAKRICAGCPVRAECLEEALVNREEFGIFGGMTVEERRRLVRDRGVAA